MPIQIVSNSNANAIELRGTNRGVFYNACLSGQVNLQDGDRVDIINDIRSNAEGETVYEAFAIHYTDLLDSEGNSFADATAAADYISTECHQIVGSGSKVVGPGKDIKFTRDETHTTVLIDDGSAYSVNALKAVAGADGHVEIWEHGDDGSLLYDDIYLASCYSAGSLVPQNISSAVNTLNALFTVSALGGGSGFSPVYPTLDGVAITPVANGGQDPIGDNIYGGTSSSQHGARYRSTETINDPGEYFTFRMANHGQFIFGLGSVDNGDVAEFDASSGNGHSGLFYGQAMYDYGAYMAPWTVYGSNAGLSYGPGWSFYGNDPMFRYSVAQANMAAGNDALFKCEIMPEGYVGCYYYDIDETNDWILLSRSTTPLGEGEYFLGIKLASTSGQLVEIPLRFATDSAAPVLNYRYIESPDGVFHYPLFATAEEANFVDSAEGGSGTSSDQIYVDDPTFTTWKSPDTNFSVDAASAPVDTASITYSEIPTNADHLYAPADLSLPDRTSSEGVTVNIQLLPQDIVATVTGLPDGLVMSGGNITGSVPYVSADTVYPVSVTRTNNYGSNTQTFDFTVEDNVAISAIPGWTVHQGNTLAPSTIFHQEHSLLQYDTQVSPGEEITWSHAESDYMIAGFLNSAGEALKTTNDLALSTIEWDVSYSIWPTSLNHLSQKDAYWDNHDVAITDDSEQWKFKYCDNGYVELYKGGVLLATSVSTFSGAKNFTVATPSVFSTNITVPTLTVSDSTFVGNPPAGFSSPLTSGSMTDATTLASDSVATLDMVLGEGERVILTKAFVEANMLPFITASLDKNYFGVPKTSAAWGSIDLHNDFDAVIRLEYQSGSAHKLSQTVGDSAAANHATINSATAAYYDYAIEWDGTDLHVIACNINDILTQPGINDGGSFSRVFTYSGYDAIRTGDLPLVFATKSGGGMGLSTTGVTKITIPTVTPPAITTPWTKAIDFSGGAERMAQEGGGNIIRNPLRQTGSTVSMPASGTVSSDGNARPFATAIVFQYDGHSSDQYIWGQVEGSGSGDDNIALKVDASGDLLLKWGRGTDKSIKNCGQVAANTWYGVYVDYNGFRATSPTVSEMADAFRIKLVAMNTNSVTNITGNWDQAARNNRTVGGNFFVGGRDAGKSFHGKVASMVVTALKAGDSLPTDAEVCMMVRDPQQWLVDYKLGNTYRVTGTNFNNANFSLNDIGCARNTQVWLMGDGTSDAYAVIRNNVHPADQNESAIRMISMVSNDVQTVSISGLS